MDSKTIGFELMPSSNADQGSIPIFFDEKLKTDSKKQNQTFAQTLKDASSGCHNLIGIDCENLNGEAALDRGKKNAKDDLQTTIQNIMNADSPGYRKVVTLKDKDGNYLIDETPGTLGRTNHQLDLAISGTGEGFALEDGTFTRDGKFKYDREGKLVTVIGEKPLKICYAEGAPKDWSLKRLKIDFDGKVTDKQTGQYLGKIEANLDKRDKVMQFYLERSNVNLPLEFMSIADKLKSIDALNAASGSGSKLDSEAVNILRQL